MLQEFAVTPATIIIIALILAGMVLAVRRIVKRGLCDCGDGCDECLGCSHRIGSCSCKECPAASDMVKNVDKAAARLIKR